jgi:hypothetical protein
MHEKRIVRQSGYLQRLYPDARATEHNKNEGYNLWKWSAMEHASEKRLGTTDLED